MNKKHIVLNLLLIAGTSLQASEVAIEMTWPLSALLWVCEGNYTAVQSNAGNWGDRYYFGNNSYGQGAIPQVNGYYATKQPFSIVLQQGVNMQNGFYHPNNSSYANYIHYFSDVVRSFRNPSAKNKREWTNNSAQSCEVTCKKGPNSSVARGMSSTGWGVTYDDALNLIATIMRNGNGNEPLQIMKWKALSGSNMNKNDIGLKGIYLTSDMFTSKLNNNPQQYYFAQTGVYGIYLPLHMISPGDYLLAADDDYVNFGPGRNDYNANLGGWKSWYYSYMPRNIPYNLLNGKPEVTSTSKQVPGGNLEMVKF